MRVPDKYAIEVTICRNLESDPDDELGFESEVQDVLESLGKEWTVTNYEFMDYDSFLPSSVYREKYDS